MLFKMLFRVDLGSEIKILLVLVLGVYVTFQTLGFCGLTVGN